MKIDAIVAQFPVSFSIQDNLEAILQIVEGAPPGGLVLCPEGCVSGYSLDTSFLERIDHVALNAGLAQLSGEARRREVHLWVGACIREKGHWLNAAFGFTPQGETHVYHKINLANHERGVFTPGVTLPIFLLNMPQGALPVGVQICRELRYPEQWGWLARQGAQLFLHLNNAVGDSAHQPVWRSHLVSRAAETQRYLLSANNAAPEQVAPTLAVSPGGHLLGELVSERAGCLRVEIDLSLVSDWYLGQCRTDVVRIAPAASPIT